MNNKDSCAYEIEECNCEEDKERNCGKCKRYVLIDSGYGYCRALPVWTVTAWCRDICGLFRAKEMKKRI